MKWLFVFLLLASLVFFAFIQWGGTGSGDTLQPRLPLNPEKIKLLPAAITPVSAPAVATPAQSAVQTGTACMEWGDFFGADLNQANAALSALKLGDNLTQRQIEHVNGYWVYIPPLKNSLEVEKKITQLRELGVADYFAVTEEGKWRNAISLGLFKTGEAAHNFLEVIKAKGVKSALAGERMSKRLLTVFVLKNPDAGLVSKMTAMQKDFPASELKTAACTSGN